MAASSLAIQTDTLALNHTSVDCVVFGFDGKKLRVLLLNRLGEEEGKVFHDMKLPGSIIYLDEDLDQAAARVLKELTGLTNISLRQFKAYGSKDRTSDPKDLHWLEKVQNMSVDRIVTIAYVALLKIHSTRFDSDAAWVPVDEVPTLAFDHNIIVKDALEFIRTYIKQNQDAFFSLLPRKFTAAQLRRLCEVIRGKEIDVRNFSKTMKAMPYVVPTGEKEKGVAHRAAMFYKFDKGAYPKFQAN